MIGTERYIAYIYYLITVLFLAITGIRVLIDISPEPVPVIIAGLFFPFIVLAIFRWRFVQLITQQVHYFHRAARLLTFDLSLYFIAAITLFYFLYFSLYQTFFVSFKVFFSTMMVGYFASIDSALSQERFLIQTLRPIVKDHFQVVSFSSRMKMLFTVTIVLALVSVTLSAIDALGLLIEGDYKSKDNEVIFLSEVAVIFLITVGFSLRLINSYTLNVRLLFESQIDILKNIQSRNFTNYVPVVSNDEFGLVSQQINRIIDELSEKEHIRKTLEQIVSPNVMEKLLQDDKGQLKAGQEYDVAILFCDLRKFTTYAESAPPEQVIFFLNAFFSKVADIVEENGGIINKFMGDAILAVYGINNEENPVEEAIRSAWDIMMHTSHNRVSGDKNIDIGIGIHKGRALAGIIGSNNRYEYTFIGDVVNTASRLDGLTKRLGYKVIISGEAYNELSHSDRERFINLGLQSIRGKTEPVHVYAAIEGDMIDEAQGM